MQNDFIVFFFHRYAVDACVIRLDVLTSICFPQKATQFAVHHPLYQYTYTFRINSVRINYLVKVDNLVEAKSVSAVRFRTMKN